MISNCLLKSITDPSVICYFFVIHVPQRVDNQLTRLALLLVVERCAVQVGLAMAGTNHAALGLKSVQPTALRSFSRTGFEGEEPICKLEKKMDFINMPIGTTF